MSRVIYTNTPATAAQESLRRAHEVRLVLDAEEGQGVNSLRGGVYGFTYSPALDNAPLFATRHFRSYETHKLTNGDVLVIGFASAGVATQLATAGEELTVVIQPEPDAQATELVTIPYSRIRHHRQHAAPNQHGFTVTVLAATEDVA